MEGYRFGYVLLLLEGCARGIFRRGNTHVQVLLPEDLCNQSPGFGALVVREEKPSPLPVGFPTDVLPDITRQHCVVIAPRYGVVLLLAAEGRTALSDSSFRFSVPYQARVLAPLLEVHLPGDLCPDLLGPADAQRLSEDDVGEDKGSLRVPAP